VPNVRGRRRRLSEHAALPPWRAPHRDRRPPEPLGATGTPSSSSRPRSRSRVSSTRRAHLADTEILERRCVV